MKRQQPPRKGAPPRGRRRRQHQPPPQGRLPAGEAPDIPLIDLRRQYAALREELLDAASRVMDSGHYIMGPEAEAFEAEFAAALKSPHCAGVSSGTQALQIALDACGVRPGDEVAVPAFTFIATATAVATLGARPVFVDVDPVSLTMDPADLERRLTPKTRAVIPVHLYGAPADLDPIMALAAERGLRVVEDCAQAHLTRYRGRCVGTFGAFGAFSFYPTKNLGAAGDAGALTTSDASLDEIARVLRNCGRDPASWFAHVRVASNCRLDEFQAALLRVKLRRLAEWTEARRRIAARYRSALAGLPLRLPPEDPEGGAHAYHMFVVQTVRRDALAEHLGREGVRTAVYYAAPVHLQPAFDHLGIGEGALPESERAAREVLSLPMFPELTPAEADRVTAAVRGFFEG
ncbi:MAG: DegT/DnrJ/EryC1/StrS family aminotransferase [Elusimicrobiota bacterium]